MSGTLLILATPIGNLSDISSRLKQSLLDCNFIFAEDTRVSKKLLHHLGINKPIVSCHNFNEKKRRELLSDLASQNKTVALVSDAGTPLISDPGYEIVQAALSFGMTIVPIPGPAACITALVGSGLPTTRFAFEGFLPEKTGERKNHLQKIRDEDRTLIFYVSPHNIQAVLKDLLEVFGDRDACIARELTKIYEEFIRDKLSSLIEFLNTKTLKGECSLIVSGAQGESKIKISDEEIKEKIQELKNLGGHLKDISSQLAKEYHLPSSYIYKLGLSCSKDDKYDKKQ